MPPSPQDVNSALATTAAGAPVTLERPVPTDLKFEKPYVARALKAVDSEHPYGTVDYPNHDLSVLQQHVHFFDTNNDGVIYPWETYSGLRRIGFNIFLSILAATILNVAFSYPTVEGWLPSLWFGVYTKNIHKGKHGSDSESYDTEGRFVPTKFEELFSKYAKTSPDRMNFRELYAMTNAMSNAFDFIGWVVNKLEWALLYLLVKDDEGFASKAAIRGVFDGSFFVYIEKELNAKKAQKAKKA